MSEQETSMKHLKHLFNYETEFIKSPNLPENEVTLVAISCEAGESIKKLQSLGIECIKINNNVILPKPINSHPDIQMLHISKNKIFCLKEHLFAGESEKFFDITEITEKTGNKYPDDVRLNCTVIDNKIICNPETISKNVLEFAESSGLTIIPVKQGYSKCSVCVINESAIITDDTSIFRAAGNFLDDVLLISKGSIGLNGYNYGFIGGCCGKIAKNKIAFNGRIESHSDANKIIDFLEKHSIETIELNCNKLYDIGGILPIMQRKTYI